MKTVRNFIPTFLCVAALVLTACDRENKPKYFLQLEEKSKINYGTSNQPVARVYRAKLERQTSGTSISTGTNRQPVMNSQANLGLAVMVKPTAGGKISLYRSGQPRDFKDSLAISTDDEGYITFLWQAGDYIGDQRAILTLVHVVVNNIRNRTDYIPAELSNLELQQNTPVGQLARLNFTSRIIENGTLTHNNQTVKVGAFGDVQSGFKQIWTAENLQNDNPASAPNGDPANIATHGSLYTYPQATNACPSGYKLASREEFICLSNYINRDCEIALPPFSYHSQKAGGMECFNLNNCEGELGPRNVGFGQTFNFWLEENSLYGYGIARYAPNTLNCGDYSSNRVDYEAFSVRCIQRTTAECPE